MLLPDNIHPENSIYYNGALVIEVLHQEGEMALIDLYAKIKEKYKMSFPMLILALDWLYLLNAADSDEEGRVSLCI